MRLSRQPQAPPWRMLPHRRQQLRCTLRGAFLLFPKLRKPLRSQAHKQQPMPLRMTARLDAWCRGSNSLLAIATLTSCPETHLADFNNHGANGGFAYNANRYLGLVAERRGLLVSIGSVNGSKLTEA